MKTLFVVLCTIVLASVGIGQNKAVHFKKLQEFLPTAKLEGLERGKPTGQTQTAMGITTSEAKVRYVPEQKDENYEQARSEEDPPYVSIDVSISDIGGVPYAMMAAMAYQQEFESETEDGYERSITLKGTYKGKESVRTGDSKDCELEFFVGNRFMVKLQASGTDDVKILQKLVDSMDLAKLEKTTP